MLPSKKQGPRKHLGFRAGVFVSETPMADMLTKLKGRQPEKMETVDVDGEDAAASVGNAEHFKQRVPKHEHKEVVKETTLQGHLGLPQEPTLHEDLGLASELSAGQDEGMFGAPMSPDASPSAASCVAAVGTHVPECPMLLPGDFTAPPVPTSWIDGLAHAAVRGAVESVEAALGEAFRSPGDEASAHGNFLAALDATVVIRGGHGERFGNRAFRLVWRRRKHMGSRAQVESAAQARL